MADDVQQQLVAEFSRLAHRHATVSYMLVGVLFFVFSLMGLGGYYGIKSYQSALGHAEQIEQQYNADRNSWQQQLTKDQSERDSLEKQIADRDKSTAQKKQKVAQNTTDPIKAMSNLAAAYGDEGSKAFAGTPLEADGRWGFDIKAVNTFTDTKIEADGLAANVQDKNTEINSLKLDVSKGQEALKACDNTVGAYKKAAKKSKWQKVVSGLKVGGAIALAAIVGHAI